MDWASLSIKVRLQYLVMIVLNSECSFKVEYFLVFMIG